MDSSMAVAYYWQFSPTQFFRYVGEKVHRRRKKKKKMTLWALKLRVRDAVEKKKKKRR